MQQLKTGTTLQGGKYKILKVLGQGGFGITYLAEQTMLERKVAIKEFFMKDFCERSEETSHITLGTESSRETANRFRDKFLKEARNIAKFDHPGIVRIYDIFEENGTAYYVMDYIAGESLGDMIKRSGAIPEAEATRYIIQAAEALAYIHERKMNHLDIKPANIMINRKNESVLIDFGLSKQYDAGGQQTSTTPVGISEGYAPMEQYKKGGVGEFSPQTDIYALGATFFKLLTGKTPPSASDVNEDGLPVEELEAKGVSRKAIETICGAMKSRKKDRMQNVREFIEGLQGEVVSESEDDIEATVVSEETRKAEEEKRRKAEEEKSRKEAEAKRRAEEKAAAERKAQEEAEREMEEKMEEEYEVAKAERNKTILWTVVAVVAIVLACVGVGELMKENHAKEQKEKMTIVTEVEGKTIVLTHGHESKRNYVYTGAVDANGVPNGQGKAQYPETKSSSSSTFTGTFVNGIPSNGELIFSTGIRYKGEFDKDGYYTNGTIWDKDGYYFVGSFSKGQPYNGTWYDPQGKVDSNVVNGK